MRGLRKDSLNQGTFETDREQIVLRRGGRPGLCLILRMTLAAQCRLSWASMGQGDQIGGHCSGPGRAGDGPGLGWGRNRVELSWTNTSAVVCGGLSQRWVLIAEAHKTAKLHFICAVSERTF